LLTVASAYRYAQDGAEYDEDGNRIRRLSYRPEEDYETSQLRYRRQNQGFGGGHRFKKGSPRQVRPDERYVERAERAEASDRKEYIFRPNQQRRLRPAGGSRYKKQQQQQQQPARVPVYTDQQRSSRPVNQQVERKSVASAPARSPQPVQPSQVASDRFYTEPEQKEVFERNADLDQLGGESFQPAYTPYKAPNTAYDNSYTPPEQKSIQEAVAAGAANYNGESYEDPQRLSFQIHGQDGPHSYRFGYDTGIGYNRQFRYEERDNYGVLHGRYGYYDQEGKLQIVNYTADPKSGFQADGKHVPKPQY